MNRTQSAKRTPTLSEIEVARAVFGKCRAYGHWWDSKFISFDPNGYVDTLRCDNCGAERNDFIDRESLKISKRQYSYPKNYNLSKSSGGRIALRVQQFQGRLRAANK